MTSRILPPAEWHRLAHTDLPKALPHLSADQMDVVVVEDGDRIVACWGVLRVTHLEGAWVDPAYRGKPSVARRLLLATMSVARRSAPRWVMTAAQTDDVRRLIEKHLRGVHVPGDMYVVPMEGVCR